MNYFSVKTTTTKKLVVVPFVAVAAAVDNERKSSGTLEAAGGIVSLTLKMENGWATMKTKSSSCYHLLCNS